MLSAHEKDHAKMNEEAKGSAEPFQSTSKENAEPAAIPNRPVDPDATVTTTSAATTESKPDDAKQLPSTETTSSIPMTGRASAASNSAATPVTAPRPAGKIISAETAVGKEDRKPPLVGEKQEAATNKTAVDATNQAASAAQTDDVASTDKKTTAVLNYDVTNQKANTAQGSAETTSTESATSTASEMYKKLHEQARKAALADNFSEWQKRKQARRPAEVVKVREEAARTKNTQESVKKKTETSKMEADARKREEAKNIIFLTSTPKAGNKDQLSNYYKNRHEVARKIALQSNSSPEVATAAMSTAAPYQPRPNLDSRPNALKPAATAAAAAAAASLSGYAQTQAQQQGAATYLSGQKRPNIAGLTTKSWSTKKQSKSSQNSLSGVSSLASAKYPAQYPGVAGLQESITQKLELSRKNRANISLGLLTKQFSNMLQTSVSGQLDLDEAATQLHVNRRRIDDIVQVLEGVGLVEKLNKTTVVWCGGSSTGANAGIQTSLLQSPSGLRSTSTMTDLERASNDAIDEVERVRAKLDHYYREEVTLDAWIHNLNLQRERDLQAATLNRIDNEADGTVAPLDFVLSKDIIKALYYPVSSNDSLMPLRLDKDGKPESSILAIHAPLDSIMEVSTPREGERQLYGISVSQKTDLQKIRDEVKGKAAAEMGTSNMSEDLPYNDMRAKTETDASGKSDDVVQVYLLPVEYDARFERIVSDGLKLLPTDPLSLQEEEQQQNAAALSGDDYVDKSDKKSSGASPTWNSTMPSLEEGQGVADFF